MNVKFNLDDVYLGWEGSSLSDDLKIILHANGTSHTMSAALRELLRLYYYVDRRETCDLPIGTGQSIHIESNDEGIRLRKPPLDIVTTFETLEESLETLLQEIFAEKDDLSDEATREEQLEYLRQYLTEHGEEIDVKDLYSRLRP